jgi:hypothetical protein
MGDNGMQSLFSEWIQRVIWLLSTREYYNE